MIVSHKTQLCKVFAGSVTNCMLKTVEDSAAATTTVMLLAHLC